jgi:hypothetical protein
MNLLVNMIPDPTTDDQWVCRPAVQPLIVSLGSPWSSGFSSGFGPVATAANGNVSVMLVLGTRVYGMISSNQYAGFDTPFCYDTATNTTLPISGVTSGNIPASLALTGDWIPPTMTLVGSKIVVCHQGFSGSNYVGFLNITNPASLSWTAGNLTGAITLTSPPYACGQFNGRAYYLINPPGGQPSAVFSDSLDPTKCTNANQVLTFGDNLPLTAAVGLPLGSTTLGGIIQALIVFKGASNIYQITGDPTTNNLAVNALNNATGTLAPNSISTTPKGIAFVAPDGLRLIDFNAHVSDPIGLGGSGVNLPFIAALHPSRMNAAYNSNVYRITLQNGAAVGSPNQEYWWDFARQRWCGPHTCTFAMINALQATFVGQLIGAYGQLVQSDTIQSGTSTFSESGVQMTFDWRTSVLPDTDSMCENSMVETTLMMALNAGDTYGVTAINQAGAVFDTLQVGSAVAPSLWGTMVWGTSLWGGASSVIAPIQLPWHYPIVFRRLAIDVQGNCSAALRIGTLHLRYQELQYLQQTLLGA